MLCFITSYIFNSHSIWDKFFIFLGFLCISILGSTPLANNITEIKKIIYYIPSNRNTHHNLWHVLGKKKKKKVNFKSDKGSISSYESERSTEHSNMTIQGTISKILTKELQQTSKQIFSTKRWENRQELSWKFYWK